MSEEKNYSILDELEMLDKKEHKRSINFQNIYKILVLNWQWFLLSLLICLGGAMLYLRYKTPTYEVSAKMLVKDEQKNRPGGNMSQMLSNM